MLLVIKRSNKIAIIVVAVVEVAFPMKSVCNRLEVITVGFFCNIIGNLFVWPFVLLLAVAMNVLNMMIHGVLSRVSSILF